MRESAPGRYGADGAPMEDADGDALPPSQAAQAAFVAAGFQARLQAPALQARLQAPALQARLQAPALQAPAPRPAAPPVPAAALGRWWIYQRERFPLLTHGLLIAVFSFSTLSYSAMARGVVHLPDPRAFVVAFGSALLFFLQMRIADEFKDAEEDARFRPYRPVPRGLVTLRELGHVALAAALVQALLALWLAPGLLPLLLLVWAYLALMSKEFFVRRRLKAHPIVYMWSHMLILPLIDLYGTACDWRVAGVAPPSGLVWLLAVTFCDGFVLEIGRKIRAPGDEERGVETYSSLWGCRPAVAAWLGVLIVTAACALVAAAHIGFALPAAALLVVMLAVVATVGVAFLRAPATARAKRVELASGLWALLMYLCLGALPLAIRL